MGRFANTLFLGLLGWTRTLFSAIWTDVSGDGKTGFLDWIAEYWLPVALALCVMGLAADFIVYLIRWRPYRVWGSFLRNIRGKEKAEEEIRTEPEITDSFQDEQDTDDFYDADEQGSFSREEGNPGRKNESSAWHWESDEDFRSEEARTLMDEGGYRGYRTDENSPESSFSDRTSRFEQAIRPRRRRAVTRLFRDDANEAEYTAPQELIDRREAYRRPVYPRNWKKSFENPAEKDRES